MPTATALPTTLSVLALGQAHDGGQYLTVPCVDRVHYGEAFTALPAAVEFAGAVYGKTGWNSDAGYAVYKTGVAVATAVRA